MFPLVIYCFFILVIPGALIALVEGGLLYGQGLAASRSALVLPAVLYSLLVSLLLSIGSVGISSLSRNRLLTLAYWAAVLFVPLALAGIVDLATNGDFPYLYVISPLTMLRLLGKAIFRLEVDGPLQWYHAIVTFVMITGASVWLAWQRLSRTEVIG